MGVHRLVVWAGLADRPGHLFEQWVGRAGHQYPGQPVLGFLLIVVFTVLLAYFLAYAVFKSKGVWTAAYLHGLFNQTLAFFMVAVFAPASIVISFSIGIPALLLALPVILLILRGLVWKETDQGQ